MKKHEQDIETSMAFLLGGSGLKKYLSNHDAISHLVKAKNLLENAGLSKYASNVNNLIKKSSKEFSVAVEIKSKQEAFDNFNDAKNFFDSFTSDFSVNNDFVMESKINISAYTGSDENGWFVDAYALVGFESEEKAEYFVNIINEKYPECTAKLVYPEDTK